MSESVDAKKAWIERTLGFQFLAAASTRPEGAAVRLAKGLLVWNSTRSYVSGQLKILQQKILKDTQDESDFDDIKANVGNIEELLEVLDDSLSDKLGELRGTTDPATKTTLSAEAKQIVIRFQKYVAEDKLMIDIDDNGFIPLDIKPKVSAALAAVAQII